MRKEYDFSKAKRGPAVAAPKGKARITIRLDEEVLDWFKARVWEQAHFQWHNIRRCTSGAATADPRAAE